MMMAQTSGANVGEFFAQRITETGRLPLFCFFVAFIVSFVAVRINVRLIRAKVRWWFKNVQVGDLHIHHVVFGVVLHRTAVGRSIFAVGANEEAARFSGLRVKRIKFWLFVVTGMISALAGIVFTFRFASARADNGQGLELSVVAVVLLGGVSGLYGGWVDTFIQRLIEVLRSIPTIPLWMGLAAALPNTWSVRPLNPSAELK